MTGFCVFVTCLGWVVVLYQSVYSVGFCAYTQDMCAKQLCPHVLVSAGLITGGRELVCLCVCVGVSSSACRDQRSLRQSWQEKLAEFMRQVVFLHERAIRGQSVLPRGSSSSHRGVQEGKVAVMFQSETEATSLRGRELLNRIVLR